MSAASGPIVIVGGGFAGVYAAQHLQRHLPRGHAIDLAAQEVHSRTPANQLARQPFAHLVLACGNVVKLDIIPGMAAHGWPLKTMGDALVLRNHLIGLLEKAQVEPDAERRRMLLSVVVVGGGFSGVEVAGEIADLLRASRRYYGDIPGGEIRVTLLHSR